MPTLDPEALLSRLLEEEREGVWLEFKHGNWDPENRWEVRRSSIPEALLALAKPANAGIADWIGCEEFGRLFGLYRRRALRVCQDATRQIIRSCLALRA